MPDITCTDCGSVAHFEAIRRAADEFCVQCDFPLFWASSAMAAAASSEMSDATLRRLPGTGGRRRLGSRDCPSCGELNTLGDRHCSRCGTDFDPDPVPDVQMLTAMPAAPPPEPVKAQSVWWAWVLALIAVLGGVAFLLWWIFERNGVL